MMVDSGCVFAFPSGNAVWGAVLMKQLSGRMFIFIQGDVNAVPGVVVPSSISHVFLQCLLRSPSYGIPATSLASSKKLLIPVKIVNLVTRDVYLAVLVMGQEYCNVCVVDNL